MSDGHGRTMSMVETTNSRCLSDDDFAVAVDGLSNFGPEREAIERHLAECDACRKHLSALLAFEQTSADDSFGAARHGESGSQVGRYMIEERLGAGSNGVVWRAHDPRLGRSVAIKQLPGGDDATQLVKMADEARFLAECRHPNIVQIYDVVQGDAGLSIVMELVEGPTLRERVAEGPMPWRELVRVGRALASGLASAHALGLFHRDIKPSNILLGLDGRARLVDFGLAGRRADDDVAGPAQPFFVGTPRYASPEQLRGDAATERSDVFGLGASLYEALLGRSATPRGRFADTGRADADELRLATVSAPRQLVSVLQRALMEAPDQRFASAQAFADALGRVRPKRRWSKMRRASTAAAFVLAAGVAAWERPSESPVDASAVATVPALRLMQAEELAFEGRFEDALSVASQAATLGRWHDDLRTALRADLVKIDAHQQLDQPEAALELARDVEARADEARMDFVLAEARTLIVWIEANGMAQYEDALAHAGPAEAVIDRLADPRDFRAELGLARGAAFLGQKRTAEAEAVYLEVAEQVDEGTSAHLRALGGLANVSQMTLDHREALRRWQRILELGRARYGDDDSRIAAPLVGLGNAYVRLGEFHFARHCFQEALKVLGHEGLSAATVWLNLGAVQTELGVHADAIASRRTALDIYTRELGEGTRMVARAHMHLAMSLRRAGRHEESLECQHRALVILESLAPGERTIVDLLHEIGLTAQAKGDLDYAEKYFREAIRREALLEARHPVGHAVAISSLGDLESERGRAPAAYALQEHALALLPSDDTVPPRTRAPILRSLVVAAVAAGETARAREVAQLAYDYDGEAGASVRGHIEAIRAALEAVGSP